MTGQNIIERSNNLIELAREEHSEKIITDMDQLDQEINRILEEAENELKPFPKFWWSEKLHKAHKM
eukprot:901985-Ditylum_brightwellii.AAC.1